MKILFLNHNQEKIGTYYRCFFLAKYLSELGHQITMVCASGKNFDLLIRRQKINPNFTIITLPRIKYSQYFTGQILLRLPLAILLVLFLDYEICHAFTVAQPQIGIPAWVAKKIRRKKLIVDWDDLWGGGFSEEHSGLIAKVFYWSERYFIRVADKITYVSEFLGGEIDKLNLTIKKFKISNGANIDQISVLDQRTSCEKLGLEFNKKYLISIGNTYTDSVGLMLQALEKILASRQDVYLIMVGAGVVPPKFQPLFKRVEKNVILAGKRPFSEVPLYLAAADCLLLPMDDNKIEQARFPMRLGDYLCAGRPIVSNAVGEVKYYLEKFHAGLVSEPTRAGELAQKTLLVLTDDNLNKTLSLNARNLAEGELNWQKIIENLNHKVYLS